MGKKAVDAGPCDGLERVSVDALHLDPANVRKHSRRNLDAIKASLVAFGQQTPISVSKSGIVLKGNGTLLAARELSWSDIAVVRTNLTDARAIAYSIADNRTAELAEWDEFNLAAVATALDSELRTATGFLDAELSRMKNKTERDAALLDIDMSPPAERTGTKSKRKVTVEVTVYDSHVDELVGRLETMRDEWPELNYFR